VAQVVAQVVVALVDYVAQLEQLAAVVHFHLH
jgi:hypothetical protein